MNKYWRLIFFSDWTASINTDQINLAFLNNSDGYIEIVPTLVLSHPVVQAWILSYNTQHWCVILILIYNIL